MTPYLRSIGAIAFSAALHAAALGGAGVLFSKAPEPIPPDVIRVRLELAAPTPSPPPPVARLKAHAGALPAKARLRPTAIRQEPPPSRPLPAHRAPAPPLPAPLVTGEPGTAALAPPHSQVPEQRHEEVPWPSPLHDENLAFPESRPDYSALARAVRDGIDAAKRYPLLARQAGIEGRTLLKFKLLRSGAVIELRVLESSGHAMLDQAAMGAVKRAAPFPEQGSGISGESIEVILPIVFRLQ